MGKAGSFADPLTALEIDPVQQPCGDDGQPHLMKTMGCVPSECVACPGCPNSPIWRWPGGGTQVLGHHPAWAWEGAVRAARQVGHSQPPSAKQVPLSPQSTLFHSHNEDPCPSRLSLQRESQPLPLGLGSTCCPLGCPSPRLLVSHFAFLQDDSVPISLATWPSQSLALLLPGQLFCGLLGP